MFISPRPQNFVFDRDHFYQLLDKQEAASLVVRHAGDRFLEAHYRLQTAADRFRRVYRDRAYDSVVAAITAIKRMPLGGPDELRAATIAIDELRLTQIPNADGESNTSLGEVCETLYGYVRAENARLNAGQAMSVYTFLANESCQHVAKIYAKGAI